MFSILDTTLRDGAQAEGISFSVSDKLRIAGALDTLGVTYIEAGNPGANPKDIEVFARLAEMRFDNAKITAFGPTRRKDKTAENDEQVQALLNANTPVCTVFGKSWDFHVTDVLNASLEENLAMIGDTVSYLKSKNREVIFDAEHFFDGCKANPEYALAVITAAKEAGADIICLCDTNGGTFPLEIFDITRVVCVTYPMPIGIHCHNDCGMAVANSIMAVSAGAVHVQGTLTGFGERCGNAALASVIPNLQLKSGNNILPKDKIALLTETCLFVSETANETLREREPYVGKSAFAHKGGMHIDAVVKQPGSFEHIDPVIVGNTRRTLTSEMSGRGAVIPAINKINPALTKDSPETKQIMQILKQREQEGYHYEAAMASFEILIRKSLGCYKSFFELADFSVYDECPPKGELSSRATIKIAVNGKTEITAAEGDGPVNALDTALRKALEVFYPSLGTVRLTDYKVRVLDGREATAARVRVLIETTDETESWATIGVSTDIIQASWLALVDSLEYKLIKEEKRS